MIYLLVHNHIFDNLDNLFINDMKFFNQVSVIQQKYEEDREIPKGFEPHRISAQCYVLHNAHSNGEVIYSSSKWILAVCWLVRCVSLRESVKCVDRHV